MKKTKFTTALMIITAGSALIGASIAGAEEIEAARHHHGHMPPPHEWIEPPHHHRHMPPPHWDRRPGRPLPPPPHHGRHMPPPDWDRKPGRDMPPPPHHGRHMPPPRH